MGFETEQQAAMYAGPQNVPVAAKRAMSPLQARIDQELSFQIERNGSNGPHDMPEVDRELTMVQGALHGVEQRVGELLARLRPVIDPKAFAAVMDEGMTITAKEITDDLNPRTDYGRRLREVQHAITQIEHALSYATSGLAL